MPIGIRGVPVLRGNGYLVLIAVVLGLLAGPADSAGQQLRAEGQTLPTLTMAHAVHGLTIEQVTGLTSQRFAALHSRYGFASPRPHPGKIRCGELAACHMPYSLLGSRYLRYFRHWVSLDR